MNLQQWVPSKWEQVVGNYLLKEICKGIVRTKIAYGGCELPDEALGNFFVSGKSRSGKTSCIKLLMKCLLCDSVNPVSLEPCYNCSGCQDSYLIDQDLGVFGSENVKNRRFEYVPIDCSRVKGKDDLENKLYYDILYRDRPRIYFLDEVHLLKSMDRDSVLLRALDDNKAIWLLASAVPDQVHPMLKGRLSEVETECPNPDELVRWVVERAKEAGVRICPNDAVELADKYFDCPGRILNQLKLLHFRNSSGSL